AVDAEQLVGGQVVVALGIGGRALDDLGDVLRRRLRHDPQQRDGFLDEPATDRLDDEASLAGGPADESGGGGCAHLPGSYFGAVARSVLLPWPRYVRVGANSPRRWPTMFSVT